MIHLIWLLDPFQTVKSCLYPYFTFLLKFLCEGWILESVLWTVAIRWNLSLDQIFFDWNEVQKSFAIEFGVQRLAPWGVLSKNSSSFLDWRKICFNWRLSNFLQQFFEFETDLIRISNSNAFNANYGTRGTVFEMSFCQKRNSKLFGCFRNFEKVL